MQQGPRSIVPFFHNLVEPTELIQHFQKSPPEDFLVLELASKVPAFSMKFDLFTTMETATRRKLEALPFSRWWRRLLHPYTCFVGTTVSEYAPFPISTPPEALLQELLADKVDLYPFLIIKDIPTEPTLVGEMGYAYSRNLVEICRKNGFVMLEGQALAYVPIDFDSTANFLMRLSRVRRKDIRRKLKSTSLLDIEAIAVGDAHFNDEARLEMLYSLYLNVYRQSEVHFDLLTAAFFKRLLQDTSIDGVVFMYHAQDKLIGYNICFIEQDRLVDKYVGFMYPQARDYNLYTVSWFHNLEYALAKGLRCYIAGWTDPEIKRNLGAHFTWTQHAVYVRNPLVRKILRSFRHFFEADNQWQSRHVSATHT
jgi:hypothetical protein